MAGFVEKQAGWTGEAFHCDGARRGRVRAAKKTSTIDRAPEEFRRGTFAAAPAAVHFPFAHVIGHFSLFLQNFAVFAGAAVIVAVVDFRGHTVHLLLAEGLDASRHGRFVDQAGFT